MSDKKVQFQPYIYVYRTTDSPGITYCGHELRAIYEHRIERKRLMYERERLRKARIHKCICSTVLIAIMVVALYIPYIFN